MRLLRLSASRRQRYVHWALAGLKSRLIEPDEHKEFLETLERNGLTRDDFSLLETDTTDWPVLPRSES